MLLYLQYKGGGVPAEVDAAIVRCTDFLMQAARPRCVWRVFRRRGETALDGADFFPQGADMRALLSESDQVILMAATLGAEVDRAIQRAQVRDMAEAVVLDACASSAIENVCDNLCRDLAERFSLEHLTDRFSPGYGDFPLAQQRALCAVLDTQRRIGLTLTKSGLLTPLKSVTAVMGVAPRPQQKRARGCAACTQFETCSFRKENRTCDA